MASFESRPHAELDDQLRFEILLSEISTFFINLPADWIDSEIESAQRRICEFLALDRSTLFQVAETDSENFILTHFYQPPESLLPPARLNAKESWPWTLKKLLGGKTLVISKLADLPPEAELDRKNFGVYGTRASVIVPLSVGSGQMIGLLTFGLLREERAWSETVVRQFELVAQIFANALARKRFEHRMRESEARLRLATNAAGVGTWIMEIGTDQIWATARTRELFHLAPGEELTNDSFFKAIHPDDYGQFQQDVQQAIQSGQELRSEFRIVQPDDSVRWILVLGQRYSQSDGEPLRLMGVSVDITARKQMETQIREQIEEIQRLKGQLEQENIYLRKEIELHSVQQEIVGRSAAMKTVVSQIEQVAQTDATVLIQGETGTGKELLARAAHRLSARKDRPLVTVNCAALPPTLVESELFGREKGAYTGALTRMKGRFELADGATLFLDEIAELPQDVQAKLLRVLEQGRFERLGSTRTLQVNVRIIAATSRDLARDADKGKFRKDLYYRLNVFPIFVPPLRERTEDIPPLVWAFVRQYEEKMGKRIDNIPRKQMEALQHYPWLGNARELRNVVEHAMIVNKGKTLNVEAPRSSSSEISAHLSLEEAERRHILGALQKSGWRLAGRGGAAEILGLKRTTLQAKMKKLGIRRPPGR
jgi:formate hydrogenlyase transcriptional activator